MDEIDRSLLLHLQNDASTSHNELAEQLGVSAASCWRRIKKLEQAGLIVGRVCLLDPEALGLHVHVIANIRLTKHDEKSRQELERFVLSRPEIIECYAMSGERDYMAHIITNDVRSYDRFLMRYLLNLTIVDSVNSNFALRTIKRSTQLPLPEDLTKGG